MQQAQQTRLSRGVVPNTCSRALQEAFYPVCPVCERGVDGCGQIKLSVAIGIRTREGEKRPGRRIQHVGLGCRGVGCRAFELHIEAKLLD